MKEEVKKEILALLDEDIDINISVMEDHYTVAEIAKEVLLDYVYETKKEDNGTTSYKDKS